MHVEWLPVQQRRKDHRWLRRHPSWGRGFHMAPLGRPRRREATLESERAVGSTERNSWFIRLDLAAAWYVRSYRVSSDMLRGDLLSHAKMQIY